MALYWLLFALSSADAARNPGFVPDPEQVPYPWRGLLITWLILALETALLGWILGTRRFNRWWKRLAVAILLYIFLSAFSLRTVVTDMPGLYYVPGMFHTITLAMLIVIAIFIEAYNDRPGID